MTPKKINPMVLAFSEGGTTRGFSLAALGDNTSGREIVIPEENIQPDSVHGYMRSGDQPITVVNLLTKEDIAQAMSAPPGQKVIINTIGKDMNRLGVTSNRMVR